MLWPDGQDLGKHLAAARRLLDDAIAAADIATRGAATIIDRLTAVGFTGIVCGMEQVRAALDTAHAQIQTEAGRVDAAVAQAMTLARHSTPRSVLDALAHIAQVVEDAAAGVGHIDTTLATAQALTRGALNGGQPQPLLQATQTIRDLLTQVDTQLTEARGAVTNMAAQARVTGARPSEPAGHHRGGSRAQSGPHRPHLQPAIVSRRGPSSSGRTWSCYRPSSAGPDNGRRHTASGPMPTGAPIRWSAVNGYAPPTATRSLTLTTSQPSRSPATLA